jgi:hypothetical protein
MREQALEVPLRNGEQAGDYRLTAVQLIKVLASFSS